ncbi:anhydro-N-acetylmuramic acid kinase [Flavobacterium sp. GT3R68]|uniref:anhydro-N-acetylmuramic acid kinase n=1 Tax=Flavobacterium sp. GT3R68 TaxID=2594437 RepID=UPI000F88F200|nr:anhydro-N-acetylmuramic acid kinase [Flavobacterium sp. GT3R68]RTY88527.1 anhydro-N-acetylmuramic acid kinase [Flavobacterium sp. GSN2]TRW92627.1 anhydro-N-acetylmuramic acid kinase [Flavobacterium sp. GT3R68]
MIKESYNVIGVMSGTSLDGVDIAHIHLGIKEQKWSFELLECETIAYAPEWTAKLKTAVDLPAPELDKLNSDYTLLLGEMIADFIKKHSIEYIDAVCSHGHTVLHQPQNGVTLQIGNLPEIATIVNHTVVCDFRIQDVQMGGQGAPLVPIGDRLLFSAYDYCINLGGFSNISFEENQKRIAYDICPVNTVLNHYANITGVQYDDKGQLARNGKKESSLLSKLNQLEYYYKPYPKSLGIEFVNDTVLPLMDSFQIPPQDKLMTFIEHIAFQIDLALPNAKKSILITGGGAYNTLLMERILFHVPEMRVVIPEKKLLEFKEALIFGLLGVLKLRDEINVLASVTGAKEDHSSGKIFQPK